jgi:hypothetical protein
MPLVDVNNFLLYILLAFIIFLRLFLKLVMLLFKNSLACRL